MTLGAIAQVARNHWRQTRWQTAKMQEPEKCGILIGVGGTVAQRGGWVVKLLDAIGESGIAPKAQESARGRDTARGNQTVEVESTIAAIADKHICFALTAVTEAAGQVAGTALRRRFGGSCHEAGRRVRGSCTGTAVAVAVELTPASNAAHAANCRKTLANSTNEGRSQVLVDGVAKEG